MRRSVESKVYRLKVTLRGARPPIWRRFEVDAGTTLFQLHGILQLVMGWTDSHLHQFRRGSTYYGDPEAGLDHEDERRVRLGQVLRRPKDRMVYEYDFGDGWEHEVVLEAIGPAAADRPPVRVLAGRRACPPEDVGGIWGYCGFLEAIQNPRHPEHAEMREWGGEFDPEAFDIDALNRYFQARTPKRRNA